MLKRETTLVLFLAAACFAQNGLRSLTADPPQPAPALPSAPSKIDAELRRKAAAGAPLKVFVALSQQTERQRIASIKQAYEVQIRGFDEQARAASGSDAASVAFRRSAAAKRDELIVAQRREIATYARNTYAGQQSLVESRVRSLGGRVIEKFAVANAMYIEIPAAALDALESYDEVVGIFESRRKYPDLVLTTKVLGAPVLWQAGYTGASQTVAIIDSGIASRHPGFAGVNIDARKQIDNGLADSCAVEKNVTTEDVYGHGTHVAGIVASQGTAEIPDLIGVAPGIGRLLAIKVGVLGADAGDCPDLVINDADVILALEQAVSAGARVVNLSLGAGTRQDDAFDNWVIDQLIDDYDVSIVVAAGNNGLVHTAYQLSDLAMSYNALSVANLDPHGTVGRNDDTIDPSSSSGPTPLGRRKPDIAAPGTNVVSLYPGDGYKTLTGTSMASPHIAGAAALLYSLGLPGAKEVKALLLNSAQGLGWSTRSGWGSANLQTAYSQAGAVESGSMSGGTSRYYRVAVDGQMNATLVWNRHIGTITPDHTHAFGDMHDLNLAVYEADTNRGVATSSSKIDNVEKIMVAGSATALVKVSDLSTENAVEPYALAFSTGDFQQLAPGRVDVNCAAADEVAASMPLTVNCTARNTGGLPIFGVAVTLNAPAGFTGKGTSSLDKIGPGESKDFTIVISSPSNARGSNLYTIGVAGIAYGDQIAAKAAMSVNLRAPVPQNCTPSLDPAPGALVLTPLAQTAVITIRFPGYNPLEPGVCSWNVFTAAPWYSLSPPLSGTGDGKIILNVGTAAKNAASKDRSGNIRISVNGVVTNYGFKQLYP